MSELNEVEKYDLTTDTIDLFYDRVINILSVDHTFTARATENHGSETVVFRGPPASLEHGLMTVSVRQRRLLYGN